MHHPWQQMHFKLLFTCCDLVWSRLQFRCVSDLGARDRMGFLSTSPSLEIGPNHRACLDAPNTLATGRSLLDIPVLHSVRQAAWSNNRNRSHAITLTLPFSGTFMHHSLFQSSCPPWQRSSHSRQNFTQRCYGLIGCGNYDGTDVAVGTTMGRMEGKEDSSKLLLPSKFVCLRWYML